MNDFATPSVSTRARTKWGRRSTGSCRRRRDRSASPNTSARRRRGNARSARPRRPKPRRRRRPPRRKSAGRGRKRRSGVVAAAAAEVDRAVVAGPDPGLDPAVGATAVAVEAEAHPPRLTPRTVAVVAGVGVGGRGAGRTPPAVGHHIHPEAAAAEVGAGAGAAAGDGVGAGVEATVAADPGHHRLVRIPHVVEVPGVVSLDPGLDLDLGLTMTTKKEWTARGMINLHRGRKKVGSEASLAPNRRTETTVGVAVAVVVAVAAAVAETNRVRTRAILAGAGPTLALDQGHTAPILATRDAGLVRHHQRKIPRRRTGSVGLGQQALRHLVDGTTREREGEDRDRTLLQAAVDPDPDRTPLLVAAGRVLDPALDRVHKFFYPYRFPKFNSLNIQ